MDAVRARTPKRLPTVLTKTEALRVLNAMVGVPQVMAKLLYGSGVRGLECVRLQVKDVDFAQHLLLVRDGKGEKDRITMLPETLVAPLQEHLARVKQLHSKDLVEGYGAVYLPYALERKYPNANREWGWQYVCPAKSHSADPRTSTESRHHLDESSLQKAVRAAARLAGIAKQYLDRRMPAIAPLCREIVAWQAARHETKTMITWRFSTTEARITLKRLYPSASRGEPLPEMGLMRAA